jgi:hypothetical protein
VRTAGIVTMRTIGIIGDGKNGILIINVIREKRRITIDSREDGENLMTVDITNAS